MASLGSKDEQTASASPVPVGPFVREQIMTRLREALAIATGELGGQLDRVRELASDVVARVDGVALFGGCGGEAAGAAPSSRLPFTALSAARGEPVSEFLLIPLGEVDVERPVAGESFAFTQRHAESAKRWFERMGRKLAIDYEHQSFEQFNKREDGLRPAAGWIGALEVRDDGLWAVNVTWTERAAELLRSGEYRYFSPVIIWADEDQTDVAALGPVALTNDPAMRGVAALAASRDLEEGRASEEGAEAAMDGDASSDGDGGARGAFGAALEELDMLRRKLALQEAEAFVERGLRLGRILDSTSMDWREDYLRDPEAAEARLSRAPVLLPPGRVIALDRSGNAEPMPRRESFPRGAAATWGHVVMEPEDLAAYERAAAAGCVLCVAQSSDRRRAI